MKATAIKIISDTTRSRNQTSKNCNSAMIWLRNKDTDADFYFERIKEENGQTTEREDILINIVSEGKIDFCGTPDDLIKILRTNLNK